MPGDDKIWQRLRRKVGGLARATVRVGVLASRGGNEIHDPDSGLTLIEIAAIHEFGAPAAGIPERSFIRATAELFQGELARLQARVARAILAERLTVPQALGLLGAWLVAKIKARMVAGIAPPLALATIARRKKGSGKGTHKPLIDTGRLYNSINWEIMAGGG